MAKFDDYRAAYAANWAALKIRPAAEARAVATAKKLAAGKATYRTVDARTQVPWWFVGLCHYRESDFNFGTYLGNGQSLAKRTTIVPALRGPFFGADAFVDGAVDALTIEGYVGATDWSIERTLYRLEGFNGYGYHAHGVNSPYLYGSSFLYGPPEAKPGKYVGDHDFDAKVVDTQLGTAVVLKALCGLDPTIRFDNLPVMPATAATHEDALAHGVAWAQHALNVLGADPALTEDGKLGRKTGGMLQQFQAENALPETGLLDAATLAELDKHLTAATTPAATKPAPAASVAVAAPGSLTADLAAVLARIFG